MSKNSRNDLTILLVILWVYCVVTYYLLSSVKNFTEYIESPVNLEEERLKED